MLVGGTDSFLDIGVKCSVDASIPFIHKRNGVYVFKWCKSLHVNLVGLSLHFSS